jgi:hypothetical protein
MQPVDSKIGNLNLSPLLVPAPFYLISFPFLDTSAERPGLHAAVSNQFVDTNTGV